MDNSSNVVTTNSAKLTVEKLTTYAQSSHQYNQSAYEMKVLRGSDTSHDGELKIKLNPLGKGDYTIAVDFFPIHPVGVTLTTLINEGVSASSGIPRKYIGHTVRNGNSRAIFQVTKTTNVGTNELLSVQFEFFRSFKNVASRKW